MQGIMLHVDPTVLLMSIRMDKYTEMRSHETLSQQRSTSYAHFIQLNVHLLKLEKKKTLLLQC